MISINLIIFKKFLLECILILQLGCMNSCEPNVSVLGEEKEVRADFIAEICIENWNEQGCLPSVCIAQAILESNLGEKCYLNNYWGLYGGYQSFDSLEDGVYEYMNFINEYYPAAPFLTDYTEQITAIYNGGYCQGNSNYIKDIQWIIEEYNLVYYDELLFDEIERKEFQKNIYNKMIQYSQYTIDFLNDYKGLIMLINAFQ